MRAFRRLCVLAALAALALPGGAAAAVQTLVFKSAPIAIGPMGVARDAMRVDSPAVDGFVVGMSADVVDTNGNVEPNSSVMLHHVVFLKVLYPDYTCSSFVGFDGTRTSFPAQRFYAEGEEHTTVSLPAGYGYPNRGTDTWALVYMLMNHHDRAETVQVRYTVRYDMSPGLRAVKPIWLDVRNCRADPIFSVPGTGRRGSTYAQHADFRMPESGFLVWGGAHLHGGGIAAQLTDSSCGAPLFQSVPTWGGFMPRPLMHEPGPMAMTTFSSPAGIPVRAGDTLRLHAIYDNSAPHVRVMGIMALYLAPGDVFGCPGGQPFVVPRTTPPHMTLPLLRRPTGPLVRNIRSTWVGDYVFGAQRVSIRRGTTFTWRFVGRVPHDVTLASGPVGFASPDTLHGSYRFRFTRRGTYKLFCSLHPTQMTQIVTVR